MSEDLEMEEIRITVGRISGQMGESNNTKEVKFTGRQLASYTSYHGELNNPDDRGTTYHLYKTEKDNFLVHVSRWSKWQGESTNKDYEVYGSLKELEGEVPDKLVYDTKEALGKDPAEKLDV